MKVARDNKLNYVSIYTLDELENYINKLKEMYLYVG